MDWNHAWGAAPANIIPRWLMGIRPLEPGFSKIMIQPRPGTLKRASMTLPTIRGSIKTRFESSQNEFALEMEIPANTTARVALPCMGDAAPTILLDGEPAKFELDGDFAVVDPVGSGKHTLMRK